jgi:hypothetical protein
MPNPNRTVVLRNQKLYAETDKAVLIGSPQCGNHSDVGKTWIPSTFIEWNEWEGVGTVSDVELPQWICEQRDLEYEEID